MVGMNERMIGKDEGIYAGNDGRKDRIDDEEPLILGSQESMKAAIRK